MTSCLDTGGAGFIGSHLVRFMLSRGDQVRVLDNHSTGHLRNLEEVSEKIEFLKGDLCDPPRIGDVRDSLADISQAEKVLGYLPQVDLVEGLRRTVESYRAGR